MKKYEAIFILDIRKVEDEGESFGKELAALIEEQGGTVEKATALGRNQFAYEIKKRKAGIYWNFIFSIDADKITAVKNKFRLDERVLRNMIINYDRPEATADSSQTEAEL